MPIRLSRSKRRPRQLPLLTPEEHSFLQPTTGSKSFTLKKSLATYPPQMSLRMTTGPERTPLKPWTQAQVAAYRKQRLKDANDANSAGERNVEGAQAHGEKSTAGNSRELLNRPAHIAGAQSDTSTNQRERT